MPRITIGLFVMAAAAFPFTVEGGLPFAGPANPSQWAAGSEMWLTQLDDSFPVWRLVSATGLSELASRPREMQVRLGRRAVTNGSESRTADSPRETPWDDWEVRESLWDGWHDQESPWDDRQDRESTWDDWDDRDSPWDY